MKIKNQVDLQLKCIFFTAIKKQMKPVESKYKNF